MKITKTPAFISAISLAVFAIVGSALVAFTFDQTEPQIAENEKQAVLNGLYTLVPKETFNNDILNDFIDIESTTLNAKSIRIYRARNDNQPIALIFSPVIAKGYNGSIRLIVAVLNDESLGGARVLSHRETPGLGDKIEASRSDWILNFNNKSLTNPSLVKWKVKKDGGDFDQFTGATITPRGIVKAIKETLIYTQKHQEKLYE